MQVKFKMKNMKNMKNEKKNLKEAKYWLNVSIVMIQTIMYDFVLKYVFESIEVWQTQFATNSRWLFVLYCDID